MGIFFYWFKKFKVEKYSHPISAVDSYWYSSINYIGEWDYTSHSYGNRTKLQNIFEEVGIQIPSIPSVIYNDEPEKYIKSILVDPLVMSKKCQELLDSDLYLEDLEERIIHIKDLSDNSYYVAYDTT